MNQTLTIESLLILGVGAVAKGLDLITSDLTTGAVLVGIGCALVGYRLYLKTKQ